MREPDPRGEELCPCAVTLSLLRLHPYERGGLPCVCVGMPDVFGQHPYECGTDALPIRTGASPLRTGPSPLRTGAPASDRYHCQYPSVPHSNVRMLGSKDGTHSPNVGEHSLFVGEHYPNLGDALPNGETPYEDDDGIPEESRRHRAFQSVLAPSRMETEPVRRAPLGTQHDPFRGRADALRTSTRPARRRPCPRRETPGTKSARRTAPLEAVNHEELAIAE